MEELLLRLRPKQDKSDAELLREKLEAQMNDAELNFYEVSSQEHAQNVMDICDRVVKNESLTITELQIGLDHPVYGEFVTWLLGDRHHNFRAIDADHSHTLELEEIIHAIDLFKAMKQEEKAKEASAGAASNPKIPPGLIRMQKGECRCRSLPLHPRC